MKKYVAALSILFLSLLAIAGTHILFKPDYSKSKVAFKIKNAGINVNGTFDSFECVIQYNPKAHAPSAISGTIQVSAINTGIEARDKHLRKEEFFDVEKYPTITFESTQILKTSSGFEADGNLMIKGVKKAVKIPFTYTGSDAGGVFEGTLTLNRRDYAVGGSSVTMSDEVEIALTVTAVAQ